MTEEGSRTSQASLGASAFRARARVWLIVGRIFAPAVLATVVTCRLTIDLWQDAPGSLPIPDHWIPNVAFGMIFVGALGWPWLLLPVSSAHLARIDGGLLKAPVVLGSRRVDPRKARIARLLVPGEAFSQHALLFIGRPAGLLIFLSSSEQDQARRLKTVLGLPMGQDIATPTALWRRSAVWRYTVASLTIIGMVAVAFVLIFAGMIAAGILGA